jgi:hypothetical protein
MAAAIALAAWMPAQAQEAATEATATEAEAVDDGLLSAEELDTLMAPVALFPDTLLTQVMMATTYPLDVVKADRFLAKSPDLSDADRAKAVEAEDWDPSVKALAAGFPDLITRMAEHVDWTEQAGEAVLAQTEDVLDAVQRLRAEADANGYLGSNDAQTVTVTNEIYTIAPANPEVVYVPTYNPQTVYTTPAPTVPYYVSEGDDWGDALATGAIIFGSAILLDEIFDDNDDWNDYWGGSRPIDWDDGDFHARPGIDIDGDVNIDRGDINIDNDRITNIDRDNINVDRDKVKIDGARPGSADRDQLDKMRDKGFKPADADRDAARAKIETRKARGEGVATMPTPRPKGDAAANRPKVNKPATADRPKVNKPAAAKPSANRPKADKARTAQKPANVSRPATARKPSASRPSPKQGSFNKSGGSRASAASSRGRQSGGGRRR